MKTPIIVSENGDIAFFNSIEDATSYLEPIDVENNEYDFYDAEGLILKALPTKPNITILEPETKEINTDKLISILKKFYENIGLENNWIQKSTLEDLVRHGAKEYAVK